MRQAYNNEDGTRHIGSDTMETIIELHDKIERRPEYADRLCLNVLQTMEVIEDQLLTPEQLAVIETRWERLKERVENLHDLLTDTTPDQ